MHVAREMRICLTESWCAGLAELERVLKLDLDPSKVMLGINNRDLQTFKVDLDNNRRIMESSAGQQVRICSPLPASSLTES